MSKKTPSPRPSSSLSSALQEQQQLIEQAVQQENRMLREALEAFSGSSPYALVDPAEAYRERGEFWEPLEVGPGAEVVPFRNETELANARQACRALAAHNEFAINGHENRISYLVGTGHRYRVTARASQGASPDELQEAQSELDTFIRENAWHRRQQEIVRRRDRDGEAFLRFFTEPGGRLRVRFIEPLQVRRPEAFLDGQTSGTAEFGVETAPHDVETVYGYWVENEFIEADQVQHRKGNVDGNVPRGVPLFYPVRRNLVRAEKLLRNMAAVSDIQTAIALIRRHGSGRQSSLERLRGSLASHMADRGAATEYFQPYRPGTILDVHGDTQYDFPAQGLDAARYVAVLQAILRAVASRLCMPEYMLSSDASNANYASSLVAEGPAVKMFERLQHELMEEDREVMFRVLQTAIDAGRLSTDLLTRINIQIEPPSVAVRNALQEAQVDEILVRSGAMSAQTMAIRHGLDPDHEQRCRATP